MAKLKTLPNPLPADWPNNLHIDYETGIETLIPYTLEEYNEWDANAILDAARPEETKAKETEIQAIRASAKAKLIAGTPLTAAEADTLII